MNAPKHSLNILNGKFLMKNCALNTLEKCDN